MVYTLLIGAGLIDGGVKAASGGREVEDKIFSVARNPIVGVVPEIFSAAIIPSLSTVTSVI